MIFKSKTSLHNKRSKFHDKIQKVESKSWRHIHIFWQLVENHASDYKLIKVKSAKCKKMTLDVAFVIERQRFHTGHQLCKLATNIIIQEVNKLQPHISKMQLIFSYLDHVSLIFEKRRVNIYYQLSTATATVQI